MKFNKGVFDKFFRMTLRMIPFIPGPELYDIFDELKKSNKSIDDKIEKAYSSLKNTAELVEELQVELSDRTSKVKELREKYEHYNKLAEVEQDKAKAFLTELSETVNKNRGKERLIAFLISFIAGLIIFFIGIFVSPYVKKVIGISKSENNQKVEVTDDSLMNPNIEESKIKELIVFEQDSIIKERQRPTKNIVHLADSANNEDNSNK